MPQHYMEIGVIVAKTPLRSAWANHAWRAHAVLPVAPAAAPLTPLGTGREEELYYAGRAVLTLHAADTAHYRDNLNSGRPSLWVSLSCLGANACTTVNVTADPYEGEALTEGVDVLVDAVPMPAEIRREVEAYVDAFHVDRPFIKRERQR